MRTELLLCVILIGGISGCGPQGEITRYSIAVSQGPGDVQLQSTGNVGNPAIPAAPSQMLSAIVPRGQQTWFFKLVGPPEAVKKRQDDFEALVKSVRFADETALPTWELPEGWQERGASGMRFATVEIEEAERKLEITVIPLETMGELDEYVLANVNRWRGQLGLAPVSEVEPGDNSDESGSTREFKLSDDTTVTMVNLIGQGSDGPATMQGFDMANHPGIGEEPPSDGLSLTYETPEGWIAGKVGGMRRAVFSVSDGEQSVEITVISLSKSGGERLPNVNRWRKQIKLDDTTATQLASELKQIPLAEGTGDYVELVGPGDAEPRESILAVLIDIGPNTWFFKLKGDSNLAEQQRQNFQDFVQSTKVTPEDVTSGQ